MNKIEFVKKYSKNGNLTFNDSLEDIDLILELIKEALKNEKIIKFHKKAKFEVITRKERNIANPNTFEKMKIYPKNKVKFSCSSLLMSEIK